MSSGAERAQHWLDAYTHAWITYDPDEIGALFSDDAEYRWYPWDEGNRGRAQIVASGEGVYGYLVVDGEATRLDRLPGIAGTGWHHLEPKGINERGWIAGTAFNPAGQPRAVLLMPR